jgi:hypothetical protein
MQVGKRYILIITSYNAAVFMWPYIFVCFSLLTCKPLPLGMDVTPFLADIGKVCVHTMKAYGGNRGLTPLILNCGTNWKWLTQCSGRFTLGTQPQ